MAFVPSNQLKVFTRLLSSLCDELASLRSSLEQRLDSIHDEQEANRHEQKQAHERTYSQLSEQAVTPDEKRKNNSRRKVELWIQGCLAFFALGAFIAASIYAWEAHRQLCEMIKQYQVLKESAEAAKSAAGTANATFKQVFAENRPWIGIKNDGIKFRLTFQPQPNPSEQLEYATVLRNFGAYPATKISTSVGLAFSKKAGLPPTDPGSSLTLNDCSIAVPTANTPNLFLFPGTEHALAGTKVQVLPLLMENKKAVFMNPHDIRQIWIAVCIAYLGQHDSYHYTKLLYATEEIKDIREVGRIFEWSQEAQ